MSASSSSYFFISYSRADKSQQQKIVAELRGRGIKVWVDTENLVPGSPAWEREIEKSIRGAAGVIVLLSPDSNNSQWVRREISFAEENDKFIFPVHIEGDENDSIPLRLSAHQRMDLRRNFTKGLDQLADALKDHLGVTLVGKKVQPQKQTKAFNLPSLGDWRKYALPAGLIFAGILCVGVAFLAIRSIALRVPQTSTDTAPTTSANTPTLNPATDPADNYPEPTGKIVFTCNVAGDEVCLINPDGSGQKRLTNNNLANSNASLAPDGKSIVYVETNNNKSELYELNLATGDKQQLTDLGQSVGSPEISPDNQSIIFHYRSGNSNLQLWLTDRDGSDPRELYRVSGKDAHDATWSADGTQILFAIGKGENNQLYIMDITGGEPQLVNDLIDTRGRSDWSGNDLIVFDQGGPFKHDVYLMNTDGSDLHLVAPTGMNAQGASLSPDGMWIAFTAYTNTAGQDVNSCEIFIIRVDGTDLRQLTDNSYCDYQPRWGT